LYEEIVGNPAYSSSSDTSKSRVRTTTILHWPSAYSHNFYVFWGEGGQISPF